MPPQCHLSILGFTLTIQQKKLSTAATELVPQRRCEIRSYVPSYKAQSGGICVCISEVTEVTAGKTAGNDDDNVCIAKKLSWECGGAHCENLSVALGQFRSERNVEVCRFAIYIFLNLWFKLHKALSSVYMHVAQLLQKYNVTKASHKKRTEMFLFRYISAATISMWRRLYYGYNVMTKPALLACKHAALQTQKTDSAAQTEKEKSMQRLVRSAIVHAVRRMNTSTEGHSLLIQWLLRRQTQ